ncbi:MAG: hypothetical protein M3Y72_22180 [Acidobacteriota bacterium]|nr:hypothetical protein [Acidobacteriota bacterium]
MADSFPIECQTECFWCWAAVGVSVNRYFTPNSPLTQCELATHILPTHPPCCENPLPPNADVSAHLQDVLSTLGALQGSPTSGPAAFADIRTQINESFPVCARVAWPGQDLAHFVVICGFAVSSSGEPWLDIADPFFPNSTVPYNEFAQAYQGSGIWTDTFLVKQP